MIFWYENLYMDSSVMKHEEKCKKIIEERVSQSKGFKKKVRERLSPRHSKYEIVILANNRENLFEIINTNQMFFSYYARRDLFVIGVAAQYEGALEIVRKILENGYAKDVNYDPRSQFSREHFSGR